MSNSLNWPYAGDIVSHYPMHLYLNDRVVPAEEAVVSVFDHGFLYGDGVYETLRSYGGAVFMMEEHLDRLERSASLIGLVLPLGREAVKGAVYQTLKANSLRDAYVRITVSRGAGPIGLDPALCERPTFVVHAGELPRYPERLYEEGVRLVIPRTRRNLREALDPRIKSLNFLNNIQAKREALEAGAFEALMLNHRDRLTECTVANVFFARGGALLTPSVECGLLDGITRGHVIALAEREGMRVIEGEFRKEDLFRAEEVFITNTTMEVMPVARVDDVPYKAGEIARRLRRAYRESTP